MNKDNVLPKVIIGYSRFLNPIFAEWAKVATGNPQWKPMEHAVLVEKIFSYIALWEPYEKKIMSGLMKALELNFLENFISVYIISGQKGGFSDPIVISPGVPDERFVDLLAHELVHRLLTFNAERIEVGAIFQKMFPDINHKLTLNHIVVHAVLQYLYLDILNEPDRLERDVSFHQGKPGYEDAWKIVQEKGYKQILDGFQSHYRKI